MNIDHSIACIVSICWIHVLSSCLAVPLFFVYHAQRLLASFQALFLVCRRLVLCSKHWVKNVEPNRPITHITCMPNYHMHAGTGPCQ